MTVYDYDKKTLLNNHYPISADIMQEDGSFTHHDYTLSESGIIAEQKIYRYIDDVFDYVNHRFYRGINIVDYTKLIKDGDDYYVSVQTIDIDNVGANYNNVYVFSEGSSLFLYNIFTGKKTLVSDNLYEYHLGGFPSNQLSYSDKEYVGHTVYIQPDGTFGQEDDTKYYYITVLGDSHIILS